MEIIRKICPTGLNNNPNRKMKAISYITIHNTGNYNLGANALMHANYLLGGSGGSETSWHYTVDDIGAYQSFEDDAECWHAGTAKGNGTSIGIEICDNDKAVFQKACKNAAELTALLLKKHGLAIDKVVQHNYWSGKDCPKEIRMGTWGVTWDGFIADVKSFLEPPKPAYQPVTSINDIVWELFERKIITDKELWLTKLKDDLNSYHLAYRCMDYIRRRE